MRRSPSGQGPPARAASTPGRRIRAGRALTIGVPGVPVLRAPSSRADAAGAGEEFTAIEATTPRARAGLRCLALPAERGSVLTLLHPSWTIIVPQPASSRCRSHFPSAVTTGVGHLREYVDRDEAAGRHARRALRSLDSGKNRREARRGGRSSATCFTGWNEGLSLTGSRLIQREELRYLAPGIRA